MNYVVYSSLLGFIHIAAASALATAQRGAKWNASPRDEITPPLKGLAGRMERASKNFFETFPLFIAAILAASLSGKESSSILLGSQIYFFARILYVPLYAFGIPYIRSLVWLVSIVGILMVLFAAL